MRVVPLVLVAGAVAAAPAPLAPPPAGAARTETIVLRDIEYSRTTVRIRRGDSVLWRWRDGTTPHDVTSTGRPRFRSSSTKARGAWRIRFRRRGTYRYLCTIHLNMRARIVVR